MKRLHMLTVAGALVAAFATAGAANAADLARKDKQFIEKAAEAGYLEIEASKLAEQKAANADVKSFAQMMVADHTKVDGELKTLASAKQVSLPAQPTRKVKSELTSLGKKTGMDFDKEYADDIGVDAHKDAVKLFENASKDSKDADIKAFAAKTLPSLQAHYEKGKALNTMVKDAAKASRPAASPMMPAPSTGGPATSGPATR